MTFRGDWQSNFVQYSAGDVVNYEGAKYKIIQPHRSQSDWPPSATPALWERADDQYGGAPPAQPSPQPQQWGGNDSYSQQKPQQGQYQQPQQGPDYNNGNGYTQNGVHVPEEETKKPWYDLDDDKKKLLWGGGLALGAAALAGGFYHEHEKHRQNGEEEKAQAWDIQNWIIDARRRTDAFLSSGPQGPVTWIFSDALRQDNRLVNDLIRGGEENEQSWYIARAPHLGSIQVGKFRPEEGATIGFAHDAIQVKQCEILIGSFSAIRWVPASGRLELSELRGAQPVEGGRDADGTPLFVAQARYKDGVYPGKASPRLKGAFITYGKKEKEVNEYEVLCYA